MSKQPPLINGDGTQAFYPLGTLAERVHAADSDAGTPQGVIDAVAVSRSKVLPESDPHVARIESVLAKPS